MARQRGARPGGCGCVRKSEEQTGAVKMRPHEGYQIAAGEGKARIYSGRLRAKVGSGSRTRRVLDAR